MFNGYPRRCQALAAAAEAGVEDTGEMKRFRVSRNSVPAAALPCRAENTAASSVRNYPVARYEGAPVNDDLSERLLDAISHLEEVADAVTPHDAHQQLDETSMQVFWKRWPGLSSWAGSLWRLLNEELAEPAISPKDSDLDEVGGSG